MLRQFKTILCLLGGLVLTDVAHAADAQNALRLKSGIDRAKNVVDRAIRSATGGPFNPVELWDQPVDSSLVNESDALALPILMQASSSLFNAGTSADGALLGFLSGNIALGNFRFAMACNQLGLSRSQIARARLAAIQPPVEFLGPFGPELNLTVLEIVALRQAEGCP